MLGVFPNCQGGSSALGQSKRTPSADAKLKTKNGVHPASAADSTTSICPVPDVGMVTPLGNFRPLKEMTRNNDLISATEKARRGRYLDAETQRGLISSNREMSGKIAYQSTIISELHDELHLLQGFQMPSEILRHQPSQPPRQNTGIRQSSSPIPIPKQRVSMRQPQHPAPAKFEQNPRSSVPNWNSELYASLQRKGKPDVTVNVMEKDNLDFMTCPTSPSEVLSTFRRRQQKKEVEFQLLKKTVGTMECQIRTMESNFTQQLDEIKSMLAQTISMNMETADRVRNLETVVAEHKTELEVFKLEASKLTDVASDGFGKMNTRLVPLEAFQTKMKEEELMKCSELGSLELRIANIVEMEGRLDALDDLHPELTPSLILELKERIRALEEFKGSFGVWDLNDLCTMLEKLSTSVSGVKQTLCDFHSRIKYLESEEDIWEGFNPQ